MKRVCILGLVLLFAIATLSAQGLTVGPKVSLGSSGYRGEDYDIFLDASSLDSELAVGFSVGGFLLFEVSPLLCFEVDVLYSTLTAKYGDGSDWLKETFSAVSFPVYARISFTSGNLKPYLLAGIDLNLLFGDYELEDSSGASVGAPVEDFVDNTFLFGVGFGAGVSLPAGSGSIDLGIRYRTNLNEIWEDALFFTRSLNVDVAYGFKVR